MKKLMAIVSATACALAATFGLAGCGNDSGTANSGETFPGVLSEDTYTTTDAAAEAFLENEIAAADTNTTFVSYARTKDITDRELSAFDVEFAAEDIEAMEWGTVTYESALAPEGAVSLAAESGAKHVKVGMFQIGGAYRYFVPVAETGEMISKSYFESVLDASKYANCTATFQMTVDTATYALGKKISVKLTTDCTLKIATDVAEMKLTATGRTAQGVSDADLTVYVFKKGDGLVAYTNVDGKWEGYDDLGISSWDELYGLNLADFIDYSYFEKTETGFKLSPIKYEKFLRQYIGTIDYEFPSAMDFSGDANFSVEEGHISQAATQVNFKVNVGPLGALVGAKASASAVNTFSDFGTTAVQIPAELQAYKG